MPQNINLNVSPYYDDFDENKNYYKVLFKPGSSVQARELTTLQSILQNQIEKFGTHFFKDGAMVIPGNIAFDSNYTCVEINSIHLGIPVVEYLKNLKGKYIIGQTSNIVAKVEDVIDENTSERSNNTLYIKYQSSSQSDFVSNRFVDGENLIIQEDVEYSLGVLRGGNTIATTISNNCTSIGSAIKISSGVYFIRGFFLDINDQSLILDQYNNTPSYRVGLAIKESFAVASNEFSDLLDNSQGFYNYAAPGADRLLIQNELIKKPLDDFNDDNFVQLVKVENGILERIVKSTDYNILENELARRTYDESGDYYVTPFDVEIKESLNNYLGNNGIFISGQKTKQGSTPSEDLACISISPGKAYIKGYEVETISNTIIDLQKPRTTSTAKNQAIQFNFGTQIELNNVYGVIPVGYSTDSYVKLYTGRTSTVGVSSGSQIGVARIYDLKLKNKLYENSASVFEASLYDIQTYTSLEISSGLGKSLSESTYIEGKNSGASGFLVSGISSTSTSLDLYQVSGNFIQNESLVINGSESNRVTKTVVDYGIDDVHQITSYITSPVTFTADTILSRNIDLTDNQSSYTITGSSSGISTVRTSNSNFYTNVKVGDIVAYTKPEDTLITYNVIKSVNSSLSLVTIGAATTVTGVNNGSLPTSLITVNDLRKVTVGVGDVNSSLYSSLNNRYVSTVDLNTSNISLRKTQYIPSINSTTFVVTIFNSNGDEILVPFDEEAYSLVYDDGTIEPLTSQKLIPNFDDANNPAQGKVTLRNLNITSTKNAYLTVTYQRVNCKPRKKTYNRCAKLNINNTNSGINTVGTGLVYSDVYGTRIEDNIISLNVSEVESIIGIYESNNDSNPVLPSLVVTTPFNEISNLIKGEEIIGEESKAVATFVETDNVSKIEFSYLSDNTFKAGENITFKESRVSTTISTINIGDKNIIRSYLFDNGNRQSYLDFSRIIRKPTVESPKKRITILFNYYSIDSNDNGTFVTVNSYDLNRYNRIPLINNYSCSDILDFRPRVTNYNTSSTLSPFDFRSRIFNVNASSAKDIVAKDTSIILSYDYYLPRIDKLFLSRYGEFNLISGIPSLTPKEPDYFDDSFEVATLHLPPYVYNVNDIRITTNKHKRYTMKDISKLDERISNVEYYTALSLLEVETQNLTIKDSSTNLDRFKSGFFVDNFSSFSKGDYLNKNYRVSIDNNNYLMRPEHYTSQLDLELSDVDNINVKRVGDLVTLNYKDVSYLENKFATRTENINPFNVISWFGSLELKPSVDNWIDTYTVREKSSGLIEEGDYETALKRLNADSNTGLSPTQWGSWENNWTGSPEVTTGNPVITSSSSTLVDSSILPFTGPFMPGFLMSVTVRDTVTTSTEVTTTTRGTRSRKGIRNKVTSKFDTREKDRKVVNTSSIINIRSRNIGIISRKMKPNSRFYAFFDSQDVSSYITPKLIEIEMISGTFVTGEKVEGNLNNASISFRLATQNHMDGVYNSPSQTYSNNPYSVNTTLASNYSSSSTVLNVDIETLSLKTESEYYGYITPGMRLVGKTSGAIARVRQIRLISDNSGTFMGSFFIPDPSVPSNPKFTTGTKVFTLTTSPTISNTSGIFESISESKFTSSGTLEGLEITTLQVRNALVTQENVNNDPEAVGIVTSSTNIVTNTTSVNRTATNLLYVDPLAQSFLVTEENGVYITKCDIFFKTKDSKGSPVTLEIREMANGVPIEKIIPYSQVTLYPKDINVSDTSLIPTTFTFQSPVYLKGSTWYSIVLLSPSSDSYNVWISRMGEEDVTSLTNQEGNRVIVSAQPSIGSLFKSQNAYTWDPSQYEDLKFTLYRAEFTSTSGTVTFHNPIPGIDNKKITTLIENPITTYSRSLLVNLNASLTSSEINLLQSGYTLYQNSNSTFSSKVKSVVGGITTNTSLSIVNSGVGYTAGIVTYTNVDLVSLTGIGTGGKIKIGVGTGSAYYADVTTSGSGYAIGDVLTIDYKDTGNLGQNVVLTIPNTSGILTASNSLILDEVQGVLNTGSGDLIINGNTLTGKYPSTAPVLSDGLHFKVNHNNHGMYSSNNLVTLSGIESDVNPVKLVSDITTSSTEVIVSDANKFTTFEGKSIGIGTTGYLLINNEIIGYIGVNTSTSTITLNNVAGHSRGVDNTVPTPHFTNDLVFKYEFNGISLRKINKTHSMSDVDISNYPIELDNYHIKIVEDSNKYFTNSKTGGSYLYTSTSSKTSKIAPRATQNDVYSILHPIVSVNTPLNTNVSSNIRTISASSVDGNEISFIDNGYEEVALNSDNEFDSTRAIFSRVNELQYLNTPNNKSIFLQLQLSTNNTKLSPVIDLKRVSMLHIMNRIDSPVNNYITDSRINSLIQDPHSATYVSRIVRLEKPADSLKVLFDAYRHESNDIRVAYRIFRNDTPDEYQVYQLFPGYGNIDSRGNTIDLSKSNGLSDTLITPSGTLDDFKAYEYNVRSNVSFTGFQIKIMMSGTDQANVPKVRDLRIIATI